LVDLLRGSPCRHRRGRLHGSCTHASCQTRTGQTVAQRGQNTQEHSKRMEGSTVARAQ
jgi:hypothetical protein